VAFDSYHMLVDPVYPSLVMLAVYLVETLRGYIATERERRQVRHAFSHYMSPALVKKLAEQPDALKLGGEMKPMTILFCDIRGFTTISEQYDAQGLTRFINRFLTPMTNIILERQGTIDKYIGDCIMAFWNAPLDDPKHAEHGCRSALAMVEGLRVLNIERATEARESGIPFLPVQIGIGLNTDICCVGNMGSDQRFDYSVLGDGVNLASRLEGQSKTYGMTIVIGEKTYAALHDFATIELDCIKVKGKTEAVRIYGLLGDEILMANPIWEGFAHAQQAMLATYRAQEWKGALRNLDHMEPLADQMGIYIADFCRLYRKRITEYQASPPPAAWDGVFEATTK
jgi:adenylate cyclase